MHTEEEYEDIRKENSKLSNYLCKWQGVSMVTLVLILVLGSIIWYLIDERKIDLERERESWYFVPCDSISLSIGAKNIQISNGLVFIQYRDSTEIRPLKSRDNERNSIKISMDTVANPKFLFKKTEDGRVISYPIRK